MNRAARRCKGRTGMIRNAMAAAFLAALGAAGQAAAADGEIKIGEINSYSALPSFTEPYRKGWQLAVDEINAHGGIDGKTLVVVSKDDAGKPGDALTAANELVSREGVAMLAGGFFSNVGLALGEFAKQHRIVYLAGEPLTDALVWSAGNRYTFRCGPRTTCRPPCWPTRPPSCRPRPGRRLRRTTNTASRPSPCSRRCWPPAGRT